MDVYPSTDKPILTGVSSGSDAQYRLSSSAENRIKLSQEADIVVIVKIEIKVLLLVLYVVFPSLVVCLFGCLVVLAMVTTVEFSVKRKSNSRQTRYEHGKQFAFPVGSTERAAVDCGRTVNEILHFVCGSKSTVLWT